MDTSVIITLIITVGVIVICLIQHEGEKHGKN